MWRKILKFLIWSAGFLILLSILTLTPVDWSDYKEQEYYKQTLEAVVNLQFEGGASSFLLAGWATTNATPSQPQNLVGYKPRGDYEFVQDSSYVRVLVLNNGSHSIAYLNYELLIIHPDLAQQVEDRIYGELPIDRVYFTATHTHSGMGGFIPGLMGKIAFGGFDEEVVKMLEDKTLSAVRSALASMDTVEVGFRKTAAKDLIRNRFIAEDPVDPFIRQLLFTNKKGETGTLITYSAHATCLSSKFMGLSGDYPQYIVNYLEEDNVDFAMFAAGTMGSHGPVVGGNDILSVKQYAYKLDSILEQPEMEHEPIKGSNLQSARLLLALREPHYRISDNIRLRPWVFDTVFGATNAHFDIVQIGNVLMVSSSGEISGVFYKEWEKKAADRGLKLIITTFNGGYIGYITPDKYYNHHYHEVRDMNWFGPYNGAYFDEIMNRIIGSTSGNFAN
jgi:hypothetical protein